jgi:hypothetical protein
MPGHVTLSYDATRNIVFTDDQWEIKTREDVDGFFAEYARFFQNIGKKFYMISNIDGLRVHADIAGYYGERARETTERHLLGFARYGNNDFARMTIRTSSTRARLQSNIYGTREEAVAAVEQMEAARLRGEKTKLFLD